MANLVQPPYQQFNDANGKPVEAGYIFIGEPGLSPVTSPLQAYWDAELTQPATNIRTTGGYPSNSGTPARLYTATNYSILVQDKNKKTIYTQLDSVDYINSASGTQISSVDTIADLRGIEPSTPNLHISVGGEVTVGDGLIAPLYYWNATSSLTDNGHSVIKPTSVVGNGRWLWINTNAPMENVSITATGTLALNYKNRIFLVNNPLAAVLTVPDGDFQGQEIQIANRGVSTIEIIGTGILASTFIVDAVTLTWLGTQWSTIFKGAFGITGALLVDTISESTLNSGVSIQASTGEQILKAIVPIGDWNMSTTDGVSVTHGLPDHTKIRTAYAMIIRDGSVTYSALNSMASVATGILDGQVNLWDANIITLSRTIGGLYDDVFWQNTSFNRGWITIEYEA